MYVISSFIFTNYESQFNFVVQNIYFVFKIYKPSRFIFDPPFLQIHPFYWQNFWPNPYLKMWNFFYHILSKGWDPHSSDLRLYISISALNIKLTYFSWSVVLQ